MTDTRTRQLHHAAQQVDPANRAAYSTGFRRGWREAMEASGRGDIERENEALHAEIARLSSAGHNVAWDWVFLLVALAAVAVGAWRAMP